MTNGGTGPYNGSLLLITSGRGPLPPSIVLVNPKSPNNATVLLDNFFGRQFDSLNDIKVHPSGKIFFTDVMCVTSHKDLQVSFCFFSFYSLLRDLYLHGLTSSPIDMAS
jgi:hypothetical protein